MLKIAHLASDEKFIENAVDIFEMAYPGQNVFFINSPKPWKYIKDRSLYRQLDVKEWLRLLVFNRKDLKGYDVVVLHSLPPFFLIPLVFLKQRYIWLGWGFDYYSRSFCRSVLPYDLVLPKTKYLTENIVHNVLKKNKWRLYSFIKLILHSKFFYLLAMRNLRVFSPVLPEEYLIVKNTYGLGCHTVYSPWNYAILEKHLIRNIELDNIESAKSILLGNSASSTNNHIEALDILSKIVVDKKIYIPLSYGSKSYSDLIKKYISNNTKLTELCNVLDDFLPIDEYNSIINNCGFVIMNHVRQQALGNIVAMIYRGAKIFLREESILYEYFKTLGVKVYSIQELELNKSLLDHPLEPGDIMLNRKLLNTVWSESVIIKRTKQIILKAKS